MVCCETEAQCHPTHNCRNEMSKGRTQSKLSELLGKNSIRYKWVGIWPAIPVALRAYETPPRKTATTGRVFTCHIEKVGGPITRGEIIVEVPPDAPPAWLGKIRERIFEIVLPLKKQMSLEFYDAAIFGYAFSAMNREVEGRLAVSEKMPPGKIKNDHKKVSKELERVYKPALQICRNKQTETDVTRKGFDYGVKCQQRELGWVPSTLDGETLKLASEACQIYETLLRNWRQIHYLTTQKRLQITSRRLWPERCRGPKGKTIGNTWMARLW